MKQILVIHGSHRRTSLTKSYVETLLNGLPSQQPVQVFSVCDVQMAHCTACLACEKTGECVLTDDLGAFYAMIEAADILLIDAPVYFNHLPSRLKQLIDRLEPFFNRKMRLGQTLRPKQLFMVFTSGALLKSAVKDGILSTMDLVAKSFGGSLGPVVWIEETDRMPFEDAIECSRIAADRLISTLWQQIL